jgi:hypothetical protein
MPVEADEIKRVCKENPTSTIPSSRAEVSPYVSFTAGLSRTEVEGYDPIEQNVKIAPWDIEAEKRNPACRSCEKRNSSWVNKSSGAFKIFSGIRQYPSTSVRVDLAIKQHYPAHLRSG